MRIDFKNFHIETQHVEEGFVTVLYFCNKELKTWAPIHQKQTLY